ncbi:pyridoxamine 5'-phosphate oxidase family protein [Nonomuraea sp. KM90]|uniref:pyridoxamine 5'-phosphate oxidase family protein n=1 Tax=Nonomuraea sp. KM90 TaxID=3457428 RepID=UPI003FCCB238
MLEPEALRLLARVPFGRIVFTRQALPAVRPVNHLVVDGQIVIRSNPGTILSSHVTVSEAVVPVNVRDGQGLVRHAVELCLRSSKIA